MTNECGVIAQTSTRPLSMTNNPYTQPGQAQDSDQPVRTPAKKRMARADLYQGV